jgi:hypothetical protein
MTEVTARDFADNLVYCMMRSPSVESGVNAGYYTRQAQAGNLLFASPCSLDQEAEHQPFSLTDVGEELGESMVYLTKHGHPETGRAMTDLSDLYRSCPAGVLPFYTNPEVCRDFSKQGEQIHDAMQVLAVEYEREQKMEAVDAMNRYFDLTPQNLSTAQKLYNLIQYELPQFYHAAVHAKSDSPLFDLKEPVQNVMSLFSDYETTWFFGDKNALSDLCFNAIDHDKDSYRAAETLALDWFTRKDYPKATDIDFFEKLSDLNEAMTRFKNKIGGDDGEPQRELVRDPAAEAEAAKQLEEQKEAEKRAEEERARERAQAQHNLEENRKRIEEENEHRLQYVRPEPEEPEIDEEFER